MNYKIVSITHSGRFEERGKPRTDGRYPKRIGRIVSDIPTVKSPYSVPLILNYVADENGNDYRGYNLHCSTMMDIWTNKDGTISIETLNSIYTFQKVEDK